MIWPIISCYRVSSRVRGAKKCASLVHGVAWKGGQEGGMVDGMVGRHAMHGVHICMRVPCRPLAVESPFTEYCGLHAPCKGQNSALFCSIIEWVVATLSTLLHFSDATPRKMARVRTTREYTAIVGANRLLAIVGEVVRGSRPAVRVRPSMSLVFGLPSLVSGPAQLIRGTRRANTAVVARSESKRSGAHESVASRKGRPTIHCL